MRRQIGELHPKIKHKVVALERGSSRSWSRRDRGAPRLEDALADLGPEQEEAEQEELTQQLVRIPDLTQALREAPVPVKRQVFESFDLQIAYDKAERRVALTATVSEAVADAFENAKALQVEGSGVVARDIAGAGFEPATFRPPAGQLQV